MNLELINKFLEISSFIAILIAISFFPLKNEIKILGKSYHKIFLSNIFFYFGNIFSMLFALINYYYPLFIQLMIFQYFVFKGFKNYNNFNKINLLFWLNIIVILLPILFINQITVIKFNTTLIEVVAALLALTGSFYMNIKKKLKISFFLYILADSIYTYFFYVKKVYIYSLLYFIFVIINIVSFIKEKN